LTPNLRSVSQDHANNERICTLIWNRLEHLLPPSVSNRDAILVRYRALNIVSLSEAIQLQKYCFITHRKRVQPVSCTLLNSLNFAASEWMATARISDNTCDALDCVVDSALLTRLLGFTPDEARVCFS
uniref:RMI1_C domain-containing protein n=1 Tax=Gongylonema pulchrum TaxID=637853 RepID=A0A183D543_9BILA